MEEWIKSLAHYITLTAEGMAVLFIVVGILQSIIIYVRKGLLAGRSHLALVETRNEFGHMLSVSLEFLIGADVLKTAIAPTWEDIGQLAAIVGIRTVLNFFLMQELKAFDGKAGEW